MKYNAKIVVTSPCPPATKTTITKLHIGNAKKHINIADLKIN